MRLILGWRWSVSSELWEPAGSFQERSCFHIKSHYDIFHSDEVMMNTRKFSPLFWLILLVLGLVALHLGYLDHLMNQPLQVPKQASAVSGELGAQWSECNTDHECMAVRKGCGWASINLRWTEAYDRFMRMNPLSEGCAAYDPNSAPESICLSGRCTVNGNS